MERAVLAPVGGIGLIVAGVRLHAYGPDPLAGNWLGGTLIYLVFIGGGACLILFTQLDYTDFGNGNAEALFFFGSAIALGIGALVIYFSVEEQVLDHRGQTTTCTVTEVKHRVETHSSGEGHTTRTHYYDYSLDCVASEVSRVTAPRPIRQDGERVDTGSVLEVLYDPDGRLATRPADSVGGWASSIELGIICFTTGITLRLLHEVSSWRYG